MTGADDAWDAGLYESHHGFVHEAAGDLVDLLDPRPGERVLDLGCGTGHLTHEIAGRGAAVVGLDRDVGMLGEARATYPGLSVLRGDARALPIEGAVDAVFSNAALHWVPEAARAAREVYGALRPGGRLVAELGGVGNVAAIVSAVEDALVAAGHDPAGRNPFFFPTVGEYASVLEDGGFEVRYARLFDRPTPLEGGREGLRHWLVMFAERFLEGFTDAAREAVFADVEDRLRPTLWADGRWVADYRRLRVVAVRPDDGVAEPA